MQALPLLDLASRKPTAYRLVPDTSRAAGEELPGESSRLGSVPEGAFEGPVLASARAASYGAAGEGEGALDGGAFCSSGEEEAASRKLLRNLRKKLQQIDKLEQAQAEGRCLDEQQVSKMSQKPTIQHAIGLLERTPTVAVAHVQLLLRRSSDLGGEAATGGMSPGLLGSTPLEEGLAEVAKKEELLQLS